MLQLEEVVTVHKKHASALEKALRCLDNDAIMSEEIDPLKDDLDYYLVGSRASMFLGSSPATFPSLQSAASQQSTA